MTAMLGASSAVAAGTVTPRVVLTAILPLAIEATETLPSSGSAVTAPRAEPAGPSAESVAISAVISGGGGAWLTTLCVASGDSRNSGTSSRTYSHISIASRGDGGSDTNSCIDGHISTVCCGRGSHVNSGGDRRGGRSRGGFPHIDVPQPHSTLGVGARVGRLIGIPNRRCDSAPRGRMGVDLVILVDV